MYIKSIYFPLYYENLTSNAKIMYVQQNPTVTFSFNY